MQWALFATGNAASKTASLVTLRSADLNHSVAGREYQRLQARVDAQLGEDARNVVALGLGADVKPPGDLVGIEAPGPSSEISTNYRTGVGS